MQKASRFFVAFLFAGCSILNARMLVVPVEFPTIQSAIEFSETGDTVLVNPGEYLEGFNFSGKKITVASQYLLTNDPHFITSTIINGVTSKSTEDNTSILTGFTIRNAKVIMRGQSHPTIRHNTFENSSLNSYSLNLVIDGNTFINSKFHPTNRRPDSSRRADSITIINNHFENSRISFSGTGNTYLCASIMHNTFKTNAASSVQNSGTGSLIFNPTMRADNGFFSSNMGSSISCGGTGNLVVDVLIDSNHFQETGIRLGGTGSAKINAVITNNTFRKISKDFTGISCGGTGNSIVTTTIDYNKFYGANFSIHGTSEFLTHADVAKNIFTGFSGSAIDFRHISLANCAVNLINNTIVGNQIGINYDNIGGLNIANCIIWGNGTDMVNVNAEQIRYSLYGTGLEQGGQSNLFSDPKLTDIANLDFRLMAGSPCIGAGVRTSRDYNKRPRPYPPRNPDMGAVPFDQSNITLSKIERNDPGNAIAMLHGSTLFINSHQQAQNLVMVYNSKGTLLEKRNTSGHSHRFNLNTLLPSPGSYVIRVIQGGNSENIRYVRR